MLIVDVADSRHRDESQDFGSLARNLFPLAKRRACDIFSGSVIGLTSHSSREGIKTA